MRMDIRLIMNRLVMAVGLTTLLTLMACGGKTVSEKRQIVVSIPPLAGIVEEIVGEDFEVITLLPSGSSPESYSPTTRQIASISTAEHLFYTGVLNFENELLQRFDREQNSTLLTNVSNGIELLSGGDCDHEHHSEEHAHHHAVDPHIWLSPSTLEVIVDNVAGAIIEANPDSLRYIANYKAVKNKVVTQKGLFRERLASAPREFLIYHPALGYLADEYGLEQISLENEGKSPTPSFLAGIVDKVAESGVKVMLYQQEYPLDIVKPIAEILNVKLVNINPLSEDIIDELNYIVEQLTNNYE